MKKLLIAIGLIGVLSGVAHAWPRAGYTANITFHNTGDSSKGINVLIDTGTMTSVYVATPSALNSRNTRDRDVILQNPNSFNVFCSTWAAPVFNVGPRWVIMSSTTFHTQSTGSIFCDVDSAAGAGAFTILGRVEYDSKD